MSDFALGALAGTGVMIVFVTLFAVINDDEKHRDARRACDNQQGLLITDAQGRYACVSTNALHSWSNK